MGGSLGRRWGAGGGEGGTGKARKKVGLERRCWVGRPAGVTSSGQLVLGAGQGQGSEEQLLHLPAGFPRPYLLCET